MLPDSGAYYSTQGSAADEPAMCWRMLCGEPFMMQKFFGDAIILPNEVKELAQICF